MTVIDTSSYSCVPCADLLSVAGFFIFLSLFPLGRRLFSAGIPSWFIVGFEQFCIILTVVLRPSVGDRNVNNVQL